MGGRDQDKRHVLGRYCRVRAKATSSPALPDGPWAGRPAVVETGYGQGTRLLPWPFGSTPAGLAACLRPACLRYPTRSDWSAQTPEYANRGVERVVRVSARSEVRVPDKPLRRRQACGDRSARVRHVARSATSRAR